MKRFGLYRFVLISVLLLGITSIWVAPAVAQDDPPVTTETVADESKDKPVAASTTPVPEETLAEIENPEDITVASDMLLTVLKIIFSLLGLVTTYLTSKAIGYFEKKTKIDVPAKYEEMIFDWVDRGIGLAHEKSHQRVQALGEKLKGSEKLEVALTFVNNMVKQYELPAMAERRLKDYIEAKLGLKRKDIGTSIRKDIEATPA